MKNHWLGFLFILASTSQSQSPTTGTPVQESRVMIAGIAHDDSVMGGGISSGRAMAAGKANVEPIAWLTRSGRWIKINCTDTPSSDCKRFDRDYLSKPHSYSVVSADGNGVEVRVERMSLDRECFGYGGKGTFTEGSIRYAAVGAERTEFFAPGGAAHHLGEPEAELIRKALATAVGDKLDSTKELRVHSVNLEGQSLIVVQRAYQDYANKPEYTPDKHVSLDFIFAVGKMSGDRFHILYWKENTGDANEQILGLIHLKSGRDFLVDTISDPEGDTFRIYGIRDGRLAVVFEGGGGGC